jgi:ankyrin repeat protein
MNKSMLIQKILISMSIGGLLVSFGCVNNVRQSIDQQQRDGVVCVQRAGLRLVVAAIENDEATIEAALKSGADANTTVGGLGPPIVVTAVTGNYRAVELLIDRGANVNATDSHGYTPLMNASISNRQDIVRLLITKGAEVNVPADLTVNGRKVQLTPLMVAKEKGYQNIVQLLREAGAKE